MINNKIIFSLLFFIHSYLFALQTSPEYYNQQAQILRNLDIEPSYLSDMIFLEFKESSMEIQLKTLID